MTSKNDTDSTLLMPTPAAQTDPGPSPRRDDTDPYPSPPMRAAGLSAVPADTSPDGELPAGAQAHREAQEFLQKFARPPRPPSPEPEKGASSDGRAFVAHHAVARPARSMGGAVDGPAGVHVHDELAELLAPSPESENLVAVGPRDAPTFVGERTRRKRFLRMLVAVSGVAAVVVIALAITSQMQAPASSVPVTAATPTQRSASAAPAATSAPAPLVEKDRVPVVASTSSSEARAPDPERERASAPSTSASSIREPILPKPSATKAAPTQSAVHPPTTVTPPEPRRPPGMKQVDEEP